jgi:hypothetical protein
MSAGQLNNKTMENKQTAVEWLEEKINSVKPTDFCSIETIKDWVKQAKQMEKEQIENAFDAGYFNHEVLFYDNAEEYYNETYGNGNGAN